LRSAKPFRSITFGRVSGGDTTPTALKSTRETSPPVMLHATQ